MRSGRPLPGLGRAGVSSQPASNVNFCLTSDHPASLGVVNFPRYDNVWLPMNNFLLNEIEPHVNLASTLPRAIL
jgi:hypothetical protein